MEDRWNVWNLYLMNEKFPSFRFSLSSLDRNFVQLQASFVNCSIMNKGARPVAAYLMPLEDLQLEKDVGIKVRVVGL